MRAEQKIAAEPVAKPSPGPEIKGGQSSNGPHPHYTYPTEKVARELRVLENRLRHELMNDEECQELRDRVLRLRRKLAR